MFFVETIIKNHMRCPILFSFSFLVMMMMMIMMKMMNWWWRVSHLVWGRNSGPSAVNAHPADGSLHIHHHHSSPSSSSSFSTIIIHHPSSFIIHHHHHHFRLCVIILMICALPQKSKLGIVKWKIVWQLHVCLGAQSFEHANVLSEKNSFLSPGWSKIRNFWKRWPWPTIFWCH